MSLKLVHLGTWAQPLERDVCVEEVAMVVVPFPGGGEVGPRGLRVSPVVSGVYDRNSWIRFIGSFTLGSKS